MALQLPEDRRHGEGREGGAAFGIEAVDRLDQPHAGDLDEVVERLGPAGIARRETSRERHEPLHQLLPHRWRVVLGVALEQSAFTDELLLWPWRGRLVHMAFRQCNSSHRTVSPGARG